jgi:hypothetical protein
LVFGIRFKFCSYGHWRTQCLYSTKVKMLCRKSVVIPMRSCTLPFFFSLIILMLSVQHILKSFVFFMQLKMLIYGF